MKRSLYGASVQGASHMRKSQDCQDSHRIDYTDDMAIISVADGHGSDSCPYSKTGSAIAVNVFYSVMRDYYDRYKQSENGLVQLMQFLNREGCLKIARTIDLEWKRRVYKQHLNRKREVPIDKKGNPDKVAVYKLYGTTLVGLVITDLFTFSFQLGDGDILSVNDTGTEILVRTEKILGVETHSLCKIDTWKKAVTSVKPRAATNRNPQLFMLSTDGLANSYNTQSAFEETCKAYYSTIKEYGFEVIEDNLVGWLKETTECGCGDDVTAVFAYFE